MTDPSREELTNIELATVAQRMLPQTCNSLGNVARLHAVRLAGQHPHLLEGLPVLLCGAGPSLDADVDGLKRLADRSVVVAVSTAAPSLIAKGVGIDVVVVMESLDTSRPVVELGGKFGSAWLDLASHPNTWEACADHPILAYHGPSPEVWHTTWALGAVPIIHGGSVTTAAAAVALLMGCRDLTLVGCNFAFADDGRVYAEGGGWGDERVEFEDGVDDNGHEWLNWKNRYDWKDDLIEQGSGVRMPTRRSYKTLEGWGGTKVRATMDYVTQLIWFKKLRALYPHARLVNCSVGGAFIHGFRHRTIAERLSATEEPSYSPGFLYDARLEAAPLVGEGVAAVRAYVESAAANAERIGRCIMDGLSPRDQPWLHDTGPVKGFTAEREIAMLMAQRSGQNIPAGQSVAVRRLDAITGAGLVRQAIGSEEGGEPGERE